MTILITALILCSALPAIQTPGTRVADLVGGKYVSGSRIAGQPPAGYEHFLAMWVDDPGVCRKDLHVNHRENFLPDSSGRIAICGRVVFQGKNFPKGDGVADGKYLSYELKDGDLIDLKDQPIRLEFMTQTVDGVYYRFGGAYVEYPNEANVYLIGNMSKFVNGQSVSENTLGLSPFNIE